VDVEVGTLSKAFGVVGGIVAGKRSVIDWMRQRARPFLFSSAMTIPDVAACLEAVNILEESTVQVERLWSNARMMKEGLQAAGFNTGRSETPIVPVIIGDAKLTQQFSRALFDEGIFVMPIVFPTVPQGTARVRVMNSATHTPDDIQQAIQTFARVGKTLQIV
jgi:glycine C-acetyltransferase